MLRFVAKNAGGMIDVMELLNEPGGFMPSVAAVIRDFWLNGYSAVRDAAGEDIGVMIGDAFMGVGVSSFAIKSSERDAETLYP